LAPLSIRPSWLLWYCLDFYFRNGGGRCYVVSVGKATGSSTISKEALIGGLAVLERQDEPTLIVIPEATLLDAADFKAVAEAAASQTPGARRRPCGWLTWNLCCCGLSRQGLSTPQIRRVFRWTTLSAV